MEGMVIDHRSMSLLNPHLEPAPRCVNGITPMTRDGSTVDIPLRALCSIERISTVRHEIDAFTYPHSQIWLQDRHM